MFVKHFVSSAYIAIAVQITLRVTVYLFKPNGDLHVMFTFNLYIPTLVSYKLHHFSVEVGEIIALNIAANYEGSFAGIRKFD